MLKKYASLFLLVFGLQIGFANAINNYTTNNATIILTQKQASFTITLPANPTTGYQWFLKQYPKHLIQPVSQQYIAAKSGLIGAGGNEQWLFKVKVKHVGVPQTGQLVLIYARAWDANDNPTLQNFNIVYQPTS